MLVVLARARPELKRIKGSFVLTITDFPEHSSLILDGSGTFLSPQTVEEE